MNHTTVIHRDEIAQLARLYWERDGRPHGRDREYWVEAEQQLKATRHLLLAELNAACATAPPINGHGYPSAMKPKARRRSARPAAARSL